MCTHMRTITNKYTGQQLFVKCGKCKSCLQEKANARAERIRRHCAGHLCLFLTLTYSDDFVPYFKSEDFVKLEDGVLPIYRKARSFSRFSHGRLIKFVTREEHIIDEISINSDLKLVYENTSVFSFKPLCINWYRRIFDDNRIGVCYYKDGINFIKKLRENLKRRFNYDKPFQYFLCSEYGESDDTARPHFHAVLFCEKSSNFSMWKAAVRSSWTYDDDKRDKQCEIARKPASYVASYVNSNLYVPDFLRSREFKAKHSYSQGLGSSDYWFQLDQVLEAIRKSDMRYPVEKNINNKPTPLFVPLPSYVVHQYFPKFTGYNRLTFDEISDIYSHPERIHGFKRKLKLRTHQAKQIETMLKNRLKLWIQRGDREGFGIYTYLAHIAKFSTSLKLNHEEFNNRPQRERYQAYDNVVDMLKLGMYSDVVAYNLPSDIIEDPNDYPFRVVKTRQMEEFFNLKDKSRKQNNLRDRNYGYNV